jgi:signal transduction histidine kinase
MSLDQKNEPGAGPRKGAGQDEAAASHRPAPTYPKPWRSNLTSRLFLLVLIAVLPAIGIQAYNEFDLRRSREADIRERVIQITRQFGEEMGELREGAKQLLLVLSQLPAAQSSHNGECSKLFASLRKKFPNYSLLGAADIDGNVFCASRGIAHWNVAGDAFFKRAILHDGVAVGNYFVDPETGEKQIHFAHRFYDASGQIAGVVFAGLDLAWLSDHLKERGLSPSASILIADREGNIIARLPNPEKLVGKNMRSGHAEIMDGDKAGWEESVGVDGITRIFGYVPPSLPPYDLFLSAGQSKAEALAPIENATRRGIFLILTGLALAAFAAWRGGKVFIQRPIRHLLEVTKAWRDGNEKARVEIKDSESDLGRLGAAFNDMATALAARHEDLRHLNATLEQRVEQRTKELAEAHRLAVLGKLIATVSHELRNPLAVIRNTTFALAEATKKRGIDVERSIERINRNIGRCVEIIGELLDYTRSPQLEFVAQDFDRWLTLVLADYDMEEGVTLSHELAAGVMVRFDSGQLQRVFVNLFDNARDAVREAKVAARTPSYQPTVSVRSRVEGHRLAIRVDDNGSGIPPEILPKIFEPLFSTKGSGVGLGLPTVKQIIDRHRGQIEVVSRIGEGTSVAIWLPLAVGQEMAA